MKTYKQTEHDLVLLSGQYATEKEIREVRDRRRRHLPRDYSLGRRMAEAMPDTGQGLLTSVEAWRRVGSLDTCWHASLGACVRAKLIQLCPTLCNPMETEHKWEGLWCSQSLGPVIFLPALVYSLIHSRSQLSDKYWIAFTLGSGYVGYINGSFQATLPPSLFFLSPPPFFHTHSHTLTCAHSVISFSWLNDHNRE